MKTNLKIAFTYIELLVVVTIIALLTSSWVFYFSDFVKNQEIEQKLVSFRNDISDYDKKVKNYQIFDYEIDFNTSTWALWYVSYVNNFDLPYNQYVNFNSNNWSWSLWTNWASSLDWKIKLYKEHKLYIDEVHSWSYLLNFDFNEKPYYKIIWTMSWEVLNDIWVYYFSEENINTKSNNQLILNAINSQNDKKWINISNFIIKNIGWKKYLLWDWVKYDKVYLFFENSWRESFIEVR